MEWVKSVGAACRRDVVKLCCELVRVCAVIATIEQPEQIDLDAVRMRRRTACRSRGLIQVELQRRERKAERGVGVTVLACRHHERGSWPRRLGAQQVVDHRARHRDQMGMTERRLGEDGGIAHPRDQCCRQHHPMEMRCAGIRLSQRELERRRDRRRRRGIAGLVESVGDRLAGDLALAADPGEQRIVADALVFSSPNTKGRLRRSGRVLVSPRRWCSIAAKWMWCCALRPVLSISATGCPRATGWLSAGPMLCCIT